MQEMLRLCSSVWKNGNVLMETIMGMYEGIIVVLTALYGSEAWILENKVTSRVDASKCHV